MLAPMALTTDIRASGLGRIAPVINAKLNGVNPQEWLTDVLDRIGKGHPINRIDELLPWEWGTSRS